MLPILKAECRKLFTVRSTYIIIAGVALLTLFFAGYIDGFKLGNGPEAAQALHNPRHLASEVTSALSATAVFCGLIAILLFAHEYRYNTIMHTLTSTSSRTKVLLAKILVMTGFAALFAVLIGALSPLASYVGIHLAGHELAPQTIAVGDVAWRGIFYVWGYAMIGLLLVALTRNQVFAIVALFFIPVTAELILMQLLKDNSVYLPFTALGAVLGQFPPQVHAITAQKAALIFGGHMAAWWTVAWLWFLRRDAN